MNKWKFSFVILLLFGSILVLFQQLKITETKSHNKNLEDLIKRIDKDLVLVSKSLLEGKGKKYIIDRLSRNSPNLSLVEYDLGNVKMRGIDLIFDKTGKLVSISVQLY